MKTSRTTKVRRALIILVYGYGVDAVEFAVLVAYAALAGVWAVVDQTNTVEFSRQWFPKEPLNVSLFSKQMP